MFALTKTKETFKNFIWDHNEGFDQIKKSIEIQKGLSKEN